MHFHYFAIIFPCVALHSNKYEFPSPKDGMCQFWLKLAEWFRRRESLNFVNVFLLFHFYLPLERDIALYLKNRGSPLRQKSVLDGVRNTFICKNSEGQPRVTSMKKTLDDVIPKLGQFFSSDSFLKPSGL